MCSSFQNFRRFIHAVLVFLLLAIPFISIGQANTWTRKQPLGNGPQPGAYNDGFAIGNKGYYFRGGVDFWEYDPINNTWLQKADIPDPIKGSNFGMCIGNKGYVSVGTPGANYKFEFWEYDPIQNGWVQKATFPGIARVAPACFSINGKGYVVTGADSLGHFTNEVWEYDPATNSWTQKSNFGGPGRQEATGFAIGDKGYIATGYDGSIRNDVWQYDPVSDSWTPRASLPGVPRYNAVSFSIGNKGYIGTGFAGFAGGDYKKDFWEYDPVNNDWGQKPDLPGAARYNAIAFSIDGKAYVGTGIGNAGQLQTDLFQFDPSTNTWSSKAGFSGIVKTGAVGFAIGNKGYIGTGTGRSGPTNDFWEYDPDSNLWSRKADCGILRRYGVGFNIGNKGYIGLGGNEITDNLIDFWEYDVQTNAWIRKANFPGGPRTGAVAFSINGKGFVATGFAFGGYYSDLWEYDPVSNTWTRKADFGGGPRRSGVAFSIGNKAYVGLGYSLENNAIVQKKDLWEYDPVLDTWTQKHDFPGMERTDAVAFNIGEKGYVGLGYGGGRRNDFWEYNPLTNTWAQLADYAGLGFLGDVGFSINSKGYVGTGRGNEILDSDHSDFWEYTPFSSSIPVTFLSLKAYQDADRVVVEWKAAEERVTKEYHVEKSIDARNFYRAASIQASGNGQVNYYSWKDLQPMRGTNYYRITSLSVNGSNSISRIVSVNIGTVNEQFSIYPNPITTNTFTFNVVRNSKDQITVRLLNSSGQLIKVYSLSHPGGSSSQTLELPASLPNDIYWLNIFGEDRKQTNLKVYIAPN